AVHLPKHGLAIAGAPPEDVGEAVAVEVANALDVPLEGNGVEVDVNQLLRAVHLPEHRGAVVVAPDDVGLAVAVEVTDALDMPVGRDGIQVEAAELVAAVHFPHDGLAVARAAPDAVAD